MGNLTEIVDNLEIKIEKMLKERKVLKQDNQSLRDELSKYQAENQHLQENLTASEKRNQSLKAANALLGSNEYKKETKLKINGLIREIDQCIVQLSE